MLNRQPTEELVNLRHRFGRIIEIQLAYQVFNLKEVQASEEKTLQNDFQVEQITHSLLVAFYSYLYSIFDKQKNATSFIDVLNIIEKNNPNAKELILIGDIIENEWNQVINQIRDLRHNIGFHFSNSYKGKKYGYDQFNNIHPLTPYIVFDGLRFFFRIANKYYHFDEGYINPPMDSEIEDYLKYLNEKIEQRNQIAFK